MEITNRILEEATGFSHRQTQRWAAAYLEPDPSAGQHSGRRRYYSFDQAVRLRIGGYLVTKHHFTIKETQQILSDVFLWLEGRNWLPSEYFKFKPLRRRTGFFVDWDTINYPDFEIHVGIFNNQFGYTVREFLNKRSDPDPERWHPGVSQIAASPG